MNVPATVGISATVEEMSATVEKIFATVEKLNMFYKIYKNGDFHS